MFAYSSRPRNWVTGLGYLADGRVRTEPLVSHQFKLEEWPEAFAMMERTESIRGVFVL
jgi:threonine dehydrogenase-like Zn-dependent dehydrogenase